MSAAIRQFINSINDKRTSKALNGMLDRMLPTKLDTAITAKAGGVQADATPLNAAASFHDVTVVATAADAIALPPARVGQFHFVKNSAALSMQVFAPTPDTIDSVATATGVPVPAGTGRLFVCLVDGNYVSVAGVPASLLATIAGITASATELNYNDITTLGTLAASKAWTSDASLDTVMPTGGLLTMQSGAGQTYASGSTLTLSGAVVQAPVFVADATPYTVLAANSGKLHIILEQTSNITLNLPVIAAGLSYKFVMGGVATEAQNWVIVATTPSFYNGGIAWTDLNDAESNLAVVYANGTSHLTLTVTTPAAGTAIEIYSNGTEWFVHSTVISDSAPTFT